MMKSIVFLSLLGVARAQIEVLGMSMVSEDPTSTPAAYGEASSSTLTAAPSATATNFYEQMPYSAYMAGGYKQLDCGYGWKKAEDGSCKQESWVRF